MKLQKQIDCARQKIVDLYGEELPLFPRPASPIRFPDGLRIPYSLHYVSEYGSFRLRRATLVLFFKDEDVQNGDCKCTVEWDDLKSTKPEERLDSLQSFHEWPALAFRPMDDVYARVSAMPAMKQIISLEMVLSDEIDKSWKPYWRVAFLQTDDTYAIDMIGLEPQDQLPPAPSKRRYATISPWALSCTSCDAAGSLRVNLPQPIRNSLDDSVLLKRVQLTAWTARHAVAEFFRGLDYDNLDMRDILVEFNLSLPARCCTDEVDNVSVITLNRLGDDPSIVLHEYAHALWYLFYVRYPEVLSVEKTSPEALGAGWSSGIEEGFADYFSGTLLVGDQHKEFQVARNATNDGSARAIDGNYHHPDTQAADSHVVGHQWANALWNLRGHLRDKDVSQKEIDKLILYAHFKPPKFDVTFPDPFKCYYESLRLTAQNMNLDGHFEDWLIRHEFE